MLIFSRLQFAFTIMFHYLFPQLTMGLALLIVFLKSRGFWQRNEHYNSAARFWIKIFGITFAFGVVTGIPMEFQFGTNWAEFSRYSGKIVGQTLAMEGLFAFFLESSFLGILLFGEKKFGPRLHWFSSLMVFLGSWLSAYFILTTNAWMQHPVAYSTGSDGTVHLNNLWELLSNPWIFWQYLHNMTAAVTTGAFVMAGMGAFFLLSGFQTEFGRTFVKTGVFTAAISSLLLIFPTGDGAAKQVFDYQPVKGAAMEGLFQTQKGAGLVILGQPNMETHTLDNPLILPKFLSFLTYKRFAAEVKGLEEFPEDSWPDNIPLVYYAYHIMVGLGTIFLATMSLALFLRWRGKLFQAKWMLWAILLSAPFPYIATTAGWMTAELGRQPWIVYGLLKTAEGVTPHLTSGNALFTLIGFLGMYFVLGLLYLFSVSKVVKNLPGNSEH